MSTLSSPLQPEDAAPQLTDLATPEEGVGAWPPGWYHATIVEGYTTGRGKVFETTDILAKDPASRNLFICLDTVGDTYVPSNANPNERKLSKGPGGKRQIRHTFNYRPNDLERIAEVKQAREHFKNVQGAWPDRAIQAASLSLGRLGQLFKALGFELPRHGGRYNVAPLISQSLDIRLTIGEKGFNEVAAMAAAGSKVK